MAYQCQGKLSSVLNFLNYLLLDGNILLHELIFLVIILEQKLDCFLYFLPLNAAHHLRYQISDLDLNIGICFIQQMEKQQEKSPQINYQFERILGKMVARLASLIIISYNFINYDQQTIIFSKLILSILKSITLFLLNLYYGLTIPKPVIISNCASEIFLESKYISIFKPPIKPKFFISYIFVFMLQQLSIHVQSNTRAIQQKLSLLHYQYTCNHKITQTIFFVLGPIAINVQQISPQLFRTWLANSALIYVVLIRMYLFLEIFQVAQLTNNCQKQRDFDLIEVSITGIPSIYYNVVCDSSLIFSPFQYGLVILTIFSVLQIIVASKFQGGDSFSNKGHYLNYASLAIYCCLLLVGEVLIIVNTLQTEQAIKIIQFIFSLFIGFIGCFICLVQLLFWLRVKILKITLRIKKLNVRIMDIVGVLFAVGMDLAWYFTDRNWIISDFIYIMIFLAIVKFVKFGSLKIAIFSFLCIAACQVLFIVLTQKVNHIYFNNLIPNIFNSPLFIFCPCISYAPNQNCSWLFVTSMVYHAMLLSYLDRFDYSRSSRIYFIVYVITLVISSVGWIVISIFVPFTLPFDIISSPICFSIVCVFAFRRGELQYLWDGQIFDSLHKNRQDEVNEILDSLKEQRSDSYKSQWFRIKYSQLSARSVRSAISNQQKIDIQMESRKQEQIQEPNKEVTNIGEGWKTEKPRQ